jgi:hypothetical protein
MRFAGSKTARYLSQSVKTCPALTELMILRFSIGYQQFFGGDPIFYTRKKLRQLRLVNAE